MIFLPIVGRELGVASRRPQTRRLRFFAALLVIAIATVLLVGNERSMAPSEIGRVLFVAVSALAFGFSLLAGVFLTADCLCSEKRDGTLGLLFLTDLKGYDVVLGKLAASSLVSVYALLAIIPILGLPLLMGGVSAGEFGRMVVVLLDTLLLSLAAGLFTSAICRDTRAAMLGCFCQMLFLTGVLFVAAEVVELWLRSRWLQTALLLPSPLFPFVHSSDSSLALRTGLTPYWVSTGIIATLALTQLALATFLLPRMWQEKTFEVRRRKARAARSLFTERPMLNPFYWLATRDRFPGVSGRVLLGFLFAVWWGFYIATFLRPKGRADEMLVVCFLMAYGLHVLCKGLVAVQASRRLSEDRRNGALELLLVAPLTPESIIEGQWRALKKQFRGILLMLWAINAALFWLFTMRNPVGMPNDVRWTFARFCVGGAILLPIDFYALGWVGMKEAVAGKRHHRAVLAALGRIIAPPIVVFFLLAFSFAGRGVSAGGVNGFHVGWFCLCVIISQSATISRKRILRQNFRLLASGEERKPAPHILPTLLDWGPTTVMSERASP